MKSNHFSWSQLIKHRYQKCTSKAHMENI